MIWNKTLFQEFEDYDFKYMETAQCKFIENVIIVTCYVDDLIRFAENSSDINRLKAELSNKFKVQDLITAYNYSKIAY